MIGGPMKPTSNGRGSGTSTWRSRKKHRKGGEKKQQRAIRKRRLRLQNPFGGRLFRMPSFAVQSIDLSIYRSIYQSIDLSIYLSIYLSLSLSIYLSNLI